MALFKHSFNYQELIDCAKGRLAGVDFPKLPLPPMLMFDEITNIQETGGTYNKGSAHATFKITPDKWFFPCHFENDPVMPGCLGDGCIMATFMLFSWKYGRKRKRKSYICRCG